MKTIRFFKLAFLSFMLLSIISSCEKDNPVDEEVKTKESILTSKTGWKLDEIRFLIDVNLHLLS